MQEYYALSGPNSIDLNMYHCGTEDCEPGHDYGPAVRDHFLIHYILKGKGIFQVGERTYYLVQGQGFLICPGIVTYYKADTDEPWSYSWVGFHGLKAQSYLEYAGITADNPVFTYNKDSFLSDCLGEMIEATKLLKSREIRLQGLLCIFLARLVEEYGRNSFQNDGESRKDSYIRKSVQYIAMNYSSRITINEIARYIGLDRSYLCSIFNECLNESPREFLINYRMNKACELMGMDNLNIGDIARSVGYDDQLQFSKIFKKVKGISPSGYRKDIAQSKK